MATPKKSWLELVKFVVRYVLLIGTPLLVKAVADLEGETGAFFSQILPIVLPYLDRLVHNNDRIPLNGISPV